MESRSPFSCQSARKPQENSPSLSIELSSVPVRNPEQFGPVISSAIQEKVQALYVVEVPIFFAHQTTLLELASAARLPTIHELRRWPEASALMSYGPDLHDLFRRSAFYVDRILKGAKPGDLPVEQPTKFELVINLKTAATLGLAVPPNLLA
jgi:putative ABC transport system substrate-binding protein